MLGKFAEREVEEVKRNLGRFKVLLVFIPHVPFYIVRSQLATMFQSQLVHMNLGSGNTYPDTNDSYTIFCSHSREYILQSVVCKLHIMYNNDVILTLNLK